MTRRGALAIVSMLLAATAGQAAEVLVPAGTVVKLTTTQPLSSRTNVKGDLVALQVAEAVSIGDQLVIPAGTPAVGQIIDARAKGAMGMAGRLVLKPLYVQLGVRTIRLTGAASDKPGAGADVVLGVALVSGLLTGRSAVIPAGAAVTATVERAATVTP